MREGFGRVRAARLFAETYGFSESKGDQDIVLSELGTRLMHYSGNARTDFLIHNVRLQDQEPFAFLREELEKSNKLDKTRIASLLHLKFGADAKSAVLYADSYGKWLVELRFARWRGYSFEYAGGKIRSLDIIAIDEANQLLDSTLYDWITENFDPYERMLEEPSSLLREVAVSTDDSIRGDYFERFVASVFHRLGFSTRLRDGVRETKLNLTYQRPGGGDLAAFCHFPILAEGIVHAGFAIACEAKSTEGPVGSTAVGQVRNLAEKIKEKYKGYVVHLVVASRSKVGYDTSGREQASPEVIHLTAGVLLRLMDLQLARAREGVKLITPLSIMLTISDLGKCQELQPDSNIFEKRLLTHRYLREQTSARDPH